MADWSKPALASTYADFVTEVSGRDTDLAVMFDPALVTPTNLAANTIRWRAAAAKWEKWSGSEWGDLAATYAISISGTASNVTGVVAAANGGTGQSSYAVGDLIYASGAAAIAKLADVAVGSVLLSGGVGAAPAYGKVGLTTHVSGILPVANGGTGVATLSGLAFGNGTSPMTPATEAQIVAAIGATAVAKATDSDNLGGAAAAAFVKTVNGQSPTFGNVTISVQTFPAGTAMLFAQAAAPTGWTKSTTHNDKTLRVVSGSGGGSGGVQAFSTVFGRTATDGTALTIAQMPSHTHAVNYNTLGANGSSKEVLSTSGTARSTTAAGSGATHAHGMDIRVQYVDVIICLKD